MSSFDKVRPSLIPYYDLDLKEPALTDEEAALVLLQMRTGIVPLPPSRHRGYGSGSRSQEPVHDGNIPGTANDTYYDSDFKRQHGPRSQSQQPMQNNSFDRISDTTTYSKRNKKNASPSESIDYNSDVRISDSPSNAEYPGLGFRPIGYDLDVAISDAPSDAEYSGLDKTSSRTFDYTLSDIASGVGYHGADEIKSPQTVDHDSDATISDPELDKKYQFVWKTSSKSGNVSDATISDPELDDKDKYAHHNSGSLMVTDHELEELISIPQSTVDDPLESSTVAPQSKVQRNKNKANKTDLEARSARHCSWCFQLGHYCKVCPNRPCTYKGCNKRGHVVTNCPKRLAKRRKDKNDWQRSYMSRKRRAASADQDPIMTQKRLKKKHSKE